MNESISFRHTGFNLVLLLVFSSQYQFCCVCMIFYFSITVSLTSNINPNSGQICIVHYKIDFWKRNKKILLFYFPTYWSLETWTSLIFKWMFWVYTCAVMFDFACVSGTWASWAMGLWIVSAVLVWLVHWLQLLKNILHFTPFT